jgi:predicted dehydrogenase
METYRLAILGLGRMGSTIDEEVVGYPAVPRPFSVAACCGNVSDGLEPLCEGSNRFELVAGADLVTEKRAAFSDRWGVSAVYEDFGRMIEEQAPDLVAICTKGENHAELATAVADFGVKMIYLEKAIACSMTEADQVLAACQANGTLMNTGVMRRFNNHYTVVRDAILAGKIGEPKAAVHYAASSLMHGHIHSMDTLSYLLGDPEIARVKGELNLSDGEFENKRLAYDPRGTYQMTFENGVDTWTVPAGQWEFEVLGSEGTIRSTNNGVGADLRISQGDGVKRPQWAPVEFPMPDARSATVTCLEDLADSLEEGRPPLGNIEVTHHLTEACLAVAQSHIEGNRWVEVPGVDRDIYVWHV